jgi:hypothetical protein
MTTHAERLIAVAVDDAEVCWPVADQQRPKPRLLIKDSEPDHAVAALRDILAEAGGH